MVDIALMSAKSPIAALSKAAASGNASQLEVDRLVKIIRTTIGLLPDSQIQSVARSQISGLHEPCSAALLVRNEVGLDDQEPLSGYVSELSSALGILSFTLGLSSIAGAFATEQTHSFAFTSEQLGDSRLLCWCRAIGAILLGKSSAGVLSLQSMTSVPRGQDAQKIDAFAAELAMPLRGVATALKGIREALQIRRKEVGDAEIILLSQIYDVSFIYAARRLETLQLLPKGAARALDNYIRDEHGGVANRAKVLRLPPRQDTPWPDVPTDVIERLPTIRREIH